jgi:hypothetical protein
VAWRLTAEGRKFMRHQRGAGERDYWSRLLPEGERAAKYYKTAGEFVLSAAVTTAVGGLLGPRLTAADQQLGAELGLILVLVVWVWLVTIAGLRDERTLTSMARSWPRFRAYREARATYEANLGRVPFPWLVAALATIGGVTLGAWLIHRAGHLSADAWRYTWPGALVAAAAAVAWYFARKRRSRRQVAAWRAERDERRANKASNPYGILR